MTDPTQKELLDQAAEIYLQLRQSPDNPSRLKAREDFLARGEAERTAYAQIAEAWAVTGAKKKPNPLVPILLIGLIGLSVWLGAPHARVLMLADHVTHKATSEVALMSGDAAHLDAGSAIQDETDGPTRDITLLRGAGYFAVTPDPRPFSVEIGGLTVTALGTEFETAFMHGEIHVSVFEGRVAVRDGNGVTELGAGDLLVWREASDQVITQIDEADIAVWRDNNLIVDGLPFEQVVAVIDRRLPGSVVIMNEALSKTLVTGRFDLSRPEQSLRNLAASQNANLISARPVTTLIYGQP